MSRVAGGKRAGARRAEKTRSSRLPTLGYSAAITACIVAWGYLVFTAINFGTLAREGDSMAWWMLAVASLGAVACLFVGLLVGARLLRTLGITPAPAVPGGPTSPATPASSSTAANSATSTDLTPTPIRAPGGHRARR